MTAELYKIESTASYDKNEAAGGSANPCVRCGKLCAYDSPLYVHLCAGGSAVSSDPIECQGLANYQCLNSYPIGASCAKRIPKRFVHIRAAALEQVK